MVLLVFKSYRILQKDKSSEKKWVCYGNMFIKMEKRKVSRLLDKGEFCFFKFSECFLDLHRSK